MSFCESFCSQPNEKLERKKNASSEFSSQNSIYQFAEDKLRKALSGIFVFEQNSSSSRNLKWISLSLTE